MIKKTANLNEVLREPMEAFTGWLSRDFESLGHRQKAKMNEGVIADILGDSSTPISRKRTKRDELRARFGYALISLLSSYHRIDRIKKLIRHFPKRTSGISKGDHLENCSLILFNETYVLEERLKAYLNECKAIDIELRGSSKIQVGIICRHYQKAFKGFLEARGKHTHRMDFEDARIKRVRLIELLMLDKEFSFFAPVFRQAIKEAKDHWLQTVQQVDAAAKQILALAFIETRPLCLDLFPHADRRKPGRVN